MGKSVAPNYANFFMDIKPLFQFRFIDDIFMIWNHSQQELDKFIEYLNNIHPKSSSILRGVTQMLIFLASQLKMMETESYIPLCMKSLQTPTVLTS